MAERREQNMMLQALDHVLQHYAPSFTYAIGGRSDGHICLVPDNDKWIVAFCERKQDWESKTFSSLFTACLAFIHIVVGNDKYEYANDDFLQALLQGNEKRMRHE
jgi:hypothetical protein